MAHIPGCPATPGGRTWLTSGPGPPLVVSGVLCGLYVEEAEALSTPLTIPGICFEQPLQFPLWYK
jgi:hypothetical protein